MVAADCALAGSPAAFVPVKFSDVTIDGEFWAKRLEINRTASIPHNLDTCESTGRIRNFAQAAGVDPSPYRGHYFHDSDVYKVLEGAAYSLASHPRVTADAGRRAFMRGPIVFCWEEYLCHNNTS